MPTLCPLKSGAIIAAGSKRRETDLPHWLFIGLWLVSQLLYNTLQQQ